MQAPLQRESSPQCQAHKAPALPGKGFPGPPINKNNGTVYTSLSRAEKCLHKLRGRAGQSSLGGIKAGEFRGLSGKKQRKIHPRGPGGCRGWPAGGAASPAGPRARVQEEGTAPGSGSALLLWQRVEHRHQTARGEEPNSSSAFGFSPCSIHSLSQARFNN